VSANAPIEKLHSGRRKLDLILVWRLDLWGRSLVDLVTTLQEVASLQVGLVSLSEVLGLTTPVRRVRRQDAPSPSVPPH
jgi:DNA invertase Pin-like site-specific DNA recombinase